MFREWLLVLPKIVYLQTPNKINIVLKVYLLKENMNEPKIYFIKPEYRK